MLDLYIVLAAVAGFIFLVLSALWLASRFGASDAELQNREEELRKRVEMERLLARRDRTRGELVEWMRDEGRD